MSALQRLPRDGREACVALGQATQWPAEEWALATISLLKCEDLPDIGLTKLIELVMTTGAAPIELAQQLITAAKYYRTANGVKPTDVGLLRRHPDVSGVADE
jgi:hypothetical protein